MTDISNEPIKQSPESEAMDEESDFIDFYQVLGLSPQANDEQLNNRIIELYNEAQNNHDHRNPSKRLHYDALCELLPYARMILLQPDKRSRYDSYLAEYESGAQNLPEFENIVREIVGKGSAFSDEITDVIAINEEPARKPENAPVAAPVAASLVASPTAAPVTEPRSATKHEPKQPIVAVANKAEAGTHIGVNGSGQNGTFASTTKPVVAPIAAVHSAPNNATATNTATATAKATASRASVFRGSNATMTSAGAALGAACIIGVVMLALTSSPTLSLIIALVAGALAGAGAYSRAKKGGESAI